MFEFEKQQTRAEREKYFLPKKDKDVKSPDIYTHHDNAIYTEIDLKAKVGKTKLFPNLRFDNSPPRDNKMYEISDISNLNLPSSSRRDDNLERFLELENVVPPQKDLS
mmetsp:Transcript_17966/g.27770  ORF Transcript_17966/g.27770 Transcript_17966/m.27770 type:complete len:108 (+) Transcript_17966:159-482(+)